MRVHRDQVIFFTQQGRNMFAGDQPNEEMPFVSRLLDQALRKTIDFGTVGLTFRPAYSRRAPGRVSALTDRASLQVSTSL